MLTEEQYKILVLFRSCDIRLDKLPQEIAEQFTQKKYIIRYRPTEPDGSYGETVMCTIAEPGRQALEKFESYMSEKCAKEKRDKEEIKAQRAANRFDMVTFGTISAVVGSIIGGLVVYYWPSIVSFFTNLFQK